MQLTRVPLLLPDRVVSHLGLIFADFPPNSGIHLVFEKWETPSLVWCDAGPHRVPVSFFEICSKEARPLMSALAAWLARNNFHVSDELLRDCHFRTISLFQNGDVRHQIRFHDRTVHSLTGFWREPPEVTPLK